MKLTSQTYVVPKLLTIRTVLPLSHTPSWFAQGQYAYRVTLNCSDVANMVLMAVIVKRSEIFRIKFLQYLNVKKMQEVKGREMRLVKWKERNGEGIRQSSKRRCASRYNSHEVKIYCVKGIAA